MPSVVDQTLSGFGRQDILAAGLIWTSPGTYQLRDPERVDLLTPAGRRRAVALVQGREPPSYSGDLRQAITRDSPTLTGAVGWSPSAVDMWSSLAHLRSCLKDRATVNVGPARIDIRGSGERVVQRIISVVLCEILDAHGQVGFVECPNINMFLNPGSIEVDFTVLAAALGRELPAEDVQANLVSLGCRVLRIADGSAEVIPPLWRAGASSAEIVADLSDIFLLREPIIAKWTTPVSLNVGSEIISELIGLGYHEAPLRRATDAGLADPEQIHDRVRAWAGGLRRTRPPRGFDVIPLLSPGRENTSRHLCLFAVMTKADPNPMFSTIWSLANRFQVPLETSSVESGDLLAGYTYTVSAESLFNGIFGLLPKPVANRWVSLAILELSNDH